MSVPYGVGTTFFYSLIVSNAFDDEEKANSLLIAGLNLLYLEIQPEIDFPLDLSLPMNCRLHDTILVFDLDHDHNPGTQFNRDSNSKADL
jgi:hypothetical protein